MLARKPYRQPLQMTKKNDDRPIRTVEELTDRVRENIPDMAKNLHEMATSASHPTATQLSAVKTILERADIIRSHLKQEQFDAVGASLQAIVADGRVAEPQRETARRHFVRGRSLRLWT